MFILTFLAVCGGLKCQNGGELDTESCICKCPAGKSGKYCEQACE